MSADTIDDLHAAEDRIGELRATIDAYCSTETPGPRNMLRAAAMSWCRPSCGYMIDGDCLAGEDTCGCTCDHPDDVDHNSTAEQALRPLSHDGRTIGA